MVAKSKDYRMEITTMADSVEKAEAILANLKAEAKKAHEAKDVFLMGILTELIAVASPILTKAINRQHRETRAKINKAHAALRKEAAAAKEAAKENPSEEAPDLSDI
jgi:hypothetical protein